MCNNCSAWSALLNRNIFACFFSLSLSLHDYRWWIIVASQSLDFLFILDLWSHLFTLFQKRCQLVLPYQNASHAILHHLLFNVFVWVFMRIITFMYLLFKNFRWWFLWPVSVNAQVNLPETGSGKVRRSWGGLVRLGVNLVEHQRDCDGHTHHGGSFEVQEMNERHFLPLALSLSRFFFALSLLWSGALRAQWSTFPQKLRCSPSQSFEMRCKAHRPRAEVFGPFQVQLQNCPLTLPLPPGFTNLNRHGATTSIHRLV